VTVAVEPGGRVVCFRDHLGVKPLYYWVDDEWIVIGSELRQVAAHPAAPRSPDVGLLGEYLSGWGESTTATVIQGVHRLPAAHGLVIDENGPHRWRYWLPPFDDRLELASPVEYEDRFRELFAEAVRCRLRAVGPVGSELSGGLDSTSITAMAATLVRSGKVPATDVQGVLVRVPVERSCPRGRVHPGGGRRSTSTGPRSRMTATGRRGHGRTPRSGRTSRYPRTGRST